MRLIIAWLIFFYEVTRFLLHCAGLAKKPDLRIYEARWDGWLSSIFGWKRGLRIRNGERCPRQSPVVFAGNHGKLDDPACLWCSVYRVSEGKVNPYFMMRDDYFDGGIWAYLPFRINDALQMCGGYGVTRDRIQLSQLRVFMDILKEPGSFIMFPGRSRSRSGLVMEYRDGIDEPGAVSFFLAHTHRTLKDTPVAAVPMMRTWHPVRKNSVVIFGEPLYLEPGLDRVGQRALDFDLVTRIGELVEIHGAHVVALLFYLRALHGLTPTWAVEDCIRAVRDVVATIKDDAYVHPALLGQTAEEAQRVLRYFARAVVLDLRGTQLHLNHEAILRTPGLETKFRRENPVQYSANQVLHLTLLIGAAEGALGLDSTGDIMDHEVAG